MIFKLFNWHGTHHHTNLGGWKMLSENWNHRHMLFERKRFYLYILHIGCCQISHCFFDESFSSMSAMCYSVTLKFVLIECPNFNSSREWYLLGHSLRTVLCDSLSRLFYFFRPLAYMTKSNFSIALFRPLYNLSYVFIFLVPLQPGSLMFVYAF